jgi:putative FmdB family regulatory protein
MLVPIYEYRCPRGHVFERFQRITDPRPESCDVCGEGPVEVVLYPVPVHFKGSGFYSTDYGRGSRRTDGSKESGEGEGTKKDEKKGDKKDEKKAAATD